MTTISQASITNNIKKIMKERIINIYIRLSKDIDNFRYSPSIKLYYVELVEWIKEHPCLLQIPKPLTPTEFKKLIDFYPYEDIRRKITELNDSIEKDGYKEWYKSTFITLSSWLRRDHYTDKGLRLRINSSRAKNRKRNNKLYKKEYQRVKKYSLIAKSKKVKLVLNEYLTLILCVKKNLFNVFGASSILTFEDYLELINEYDYRSILSAFKVLNFFEYLTVSEVTLLENIDELSNELGLEIIDVEKRDFELIDDIKRIIDI